MHVLPEQLTPQSLDDPAPDIAAEVVRDVITHSAHEEEHHDGRRHEPEQVMRPRVVRERRVQKILQEFDEARVRGCEQRAAGDREREGFPVRLRVLQEPGVDLPRAGSGNRWRRPPYIVQGCPAGSSLTVAMLISVKPRRPSTSMAVMTD